MNKELLPIGTVVLLKSGIEKVMITGYSSKNKGENRVYDYNGCIFPEGFMDNVFCLFDKEQIDDVIYRGLENDEFKDYVYEQHSTINISSSSNGLKDTIRNNTDKKPSGRTPAAPTNPRSKSEMKAKYGIEKISGENN